MRRRKRRNGFSVHVGHLNHWSHLEVDGYCVTLEFNRVSYSEIADIQAHIAWDSVVVPCYFICLLFLRNPESLCKLYMYSTVSNLTVFNFNSTQ